MNNIYENITISLVIVLALVSIVCLLIWADKTKSLIIKLFILIPFYGGIVFRMVKDIVVNFNIGKVFFASLEIISLLVLVGGFLIVSIIDYRKILSKIISDYKKRK